MRSDELRCFIAAELSSTVRNRLIREIGFLQLAGASVKWVPKDNLHLTLRFIGGVRTEEVIELCEAIGESCSGMRNCRPTVSGLMTFPPGKKTPRIVAAGVIGDTDPLKDLFNRFQKGLAEIGFRPERKGLRPHVTLGRIRGSDQIDALVERIEENQDRAFGVFNVDRVHLMMSDPTPKGPEYSSMKVFPLG